jgi:hypothetical protein
MDRIEEITIPILLDHLEYAWGIIANAGGGDWNNETEEWTEAANRWRHTWHLILDAKVPQPNTEIETNG